MIDDYPRLDDRKVLMGRIEEFLAVEKFEMDETDQFRLCQIVDALLAKRFRGRCRVKRMEFHKLTPDEQARARSRHVGVRHSQLSPAGYRRLLEMPNE